MFERKKVTVEQELVPIKEKPKSLADIFSKLSVSGSVSPVDGIMELTHADNELPMKSDIPNPSGFTACQVLAAYNSSIGFEDVAELLREVVNWQYQHNCARKGKRADLAFNALGQNAQKQQELLIQKETKGLLSK